MSQKSERMAYDAGRALPHLTWDDDAPDAQKQLGEHHCPFAEGDPDRDAWLRGLRDSLQAQDEKGRANLLKRIDERLEGADHAR